MLCSHLPLHPGLLHAKITGLVAAQADGSLRPSAARAEELLKACLLLDKRQPLGLHLLVHLAEASSPLR